MHIKNKIVLDISKKFMNSYAKKHLQLKDEIDGLPECSEDKKYLIYIHIPFCSVFCPYCSFNKFRYTQEKAQKYYKYLREELLHIKELGYDFNYLVIGGGTPLINIGELVKTIELVKKLFSIRNVSCESDPNNIKQNTVENLKGLVDRLSIGVQTFDDNMLKKMGRYSKFGSGREIHEKIQSVLGILPIVSVDLIFNLPNQSKKELLNDIFMLKSLSPEQSSFYPLMSSFLTKKKISKTLGVSKTSKEFEFYNIIKESLKETYPSKQGWSFSKTKKALIDEYVINNNEYVGVGSGSFSFLNNTLYQNEFGLDEYSMLIEKQKSSAIRKKEFSVKSTMYYQLMVALFNGELSKQKFKTQFNKDIDKSLFFELFFLKKAGAIKCSKNFIKSTDFGEYLFLVLMKFFYMKMDMIRDNARKNINFE